MGRQVGIIVVGLGEGIASAVVVDGRQVVVRLIVHLLVDIDGREVGGPDVVEGIILETVVEHVLSKTLATDGELCLGSALELDGHHVVNLLVGIFGIELYGECESVVNGNLVAGSDRRGEVLGTEGDSLHLEGVLATVEHRELFAAGSSLAIVHLAGIPSVLVEGSIVRDAAVDDDIIEGSTVVTAAVAMTDPAELHLLAGIGHKVDVLVAPVLLAVGTLNVVFRQVGQLCPSTVGKYLEHDVAIAIATLHVLLLQQTGVVDEKVGGVLITPSERDGHARTFGRQVELG